VFESHRAWAEFVERSAGPQPKLTLSVLELRVSHGGRLVSSGLVGSRLGVAGRGAWKEEKQRRKRGTGEKGGLGVLRRGEEGEATHRGLDWARRRLPVTACMAGGEGGGEEGQGKQSIGKKKKRKKESSGRGGVHACL